MSSVLARSTPAIMRGCLFALLLMPLSALRVPRRAALHAGTAAAFWSSQRAHAAGRQTTPVPYKIAADTSFVQEADALWAIERHQRVDVETSFASIPTSFCRAGAGNPGPKLVFLHGADASFFEWRYILRRLSDTYDCTALDWWGGGWTDRRAIYERSVSCLLYTSPSPRDS